jgi:hypothetical protein
MTIDVEAESEALRQRSAELVEMLDAALVTVDRTGIREVLAESKQLHTEALAARDRVSQRLAKGQPAGVPLGPAGSIRKVRTDAWGHDLDPHLKGRLACTPELAAYWVHRRDVVAGAFRAAFVEAGERFAQNPSLVAAATGHLGLVRSRGTFMAEGGDTLEAALNRHQDVGPTIRSGVIEADGISARAEAALSELATAPLAAAVEKEHGPVAQLSTAQWVNSRWARAVGDENAVLDVMTGEPVGVTPVEVKPVAGRK